MSQHFLNNPQVRTGVEHVGREGVPKGVNALQLYLEARDQGILISPGELFSSNKNKYQRSIRLTYSQPWTTEREAAIRRLGELASKQLNKS